MKSKIFYIKIKVLFIFKIFKKSSFYLYKSCFIMYSLVCHLFFIYIFSSASMDDLSLFFLSVSCSIFFYFYLWYEFSDARWMSFMCNQTELKTIFLNVMQCRDFKYFDGKPLPPKISPNKKMMKPKVAFDGQP